MNLYDDFCKDMKGDLAEETYRGYKSEINRFSQWIVDNRGKDSLADVSTRDIKAYLLHLSDEGYATSTIKTRYTAIRKFYSWLENLHGNPTEPFELENEEWESPCNFIDVGNLRVFKENGESMKEKHAGENVSLSQEKIQLLIDNVSSPKVRNKLLIALMYETGMRRHEARDLKQKDVRIEEGKVKIYDSKTDSTRTGTFGARVKSLLREYILYGNRDSFKKSADSEYLFLSRQSEQMNVKQINRTVKKAAENADIQEKVGEDQQGRPRYLITAHTLRKSFAMSCLKNDISVREIQKALGHSDIPTTEDYLGLDSKDITDTLEQFGPKLE